MSSGKKYLIVGGVATLVALIAFGLIIPWEGRAATVKHDLAWIPDQKDPKVRAAYDGGEMEIVQIDQLCSLRVLVEKVGYSAYFSHEVEGGVAIATWLVLVPDEILLKYELKYEEEVVPQMGPKATDTTVEDNVLYITTRLDENDMLGAIPGAVIFSVIFGLVAVVVVGTRSTD